MKNHLIASEHDIQTQLLSVLPYYGIFAWRNNSGMVPIGEGKYRRMIKLGVPGLPDIMGVIGPKFFNRKYMGRTIGIEVKKPSNKPTDIQNQMMEKLHEHGALVMVIHSLDELKTTLEQIKQI